MSCEHDRRFHLMFAKDGCCACELESTRAEVERLRKALKLIGPPMCEHLHHRKADYHESGPCPVEQRIERLIANEAEGGEE